MREGTAALRILFLALLLPALLLAALLLAACEGEGGKEGREARPSAPVEDPEAWEGDVAALARLLRPKEGTEEDWALVREKAGWAWSEGLDAVEMGEAVARIGLTFVGTRYLPNTLELPDPEGVVVNLQELDCVTFVENALALARLIRLAEPEILDSETRLRSLYRRLLEELRYRAGRVDGYASRLHYFSDWIRDNEARGIVRELTAELGGEPELEAVDFMSAHPEAYRQMANPETYYLMRQAEIRLSGLTRHKIPQEAITAVSGEIRDGDIIAATSTMEGLDVAHVGIALWQNGRLHLLHAPLVGERVEVSDLLPLAERILRVEGQDGILVARPLPPS